MFNNKFNSSKKDPLVEAVQGAMQDGDLRRQAIAYVNEQFGVFSRNAVVNEHKAAYDAALEEAYKSLKEGVQIDEMAHKALTAAGYKAGPKDSTTGFGRTYTKGKKSVYVDADGFARHGSGSKATVTHGNKETSAYLNRGKKMEESNDGNLANNYPPYDKVTRGDVIAGRLGKDQMGGKKKMEEKKDCYEEGTAEAETSMNVTSGNKPSTPAQTSAADTGLSKSDRAGLTSTIKSIKESIARKKDIAKGGVTAPIEYADKMGFANPGAISKLDEAWSKLKEARKCMEEESDTFDSTHLDEAYANYIAEAINEYGLQEEHPIVTAENLYMFNEAYIAAVLGEAAKHEKEKAEDHEEKAKELDEARMRAEKECNEEKEEKEEHDEDTKKRKVLAKTLKHLARKKKMEEESSFKYAHLSGKTVNEAGAADYMKGAAKNFSQAMKTGFTKTASDLGSSSKPVGDMASKMSSAKMTPGSTNYAAQKPLGSMTSRMSSAAQKPLGSVASKMSSAGTTAALNKAATSAPSTVSRLTGLAGRANPIVGAAMTGAAASQALGDLATGTETGRAIGKAIGDNVPGAKALAAGMKSAGEAIGVRSPDRFSNIPRTTIRAPGSPEAKAAATQLKADKKAPSVGDDRYTIKKGDTLSGIAKRTGTSVSSLAASNKIADPNKISAGAKLSVNAAKTPLGDVPSTTKNPAGPPMPASPKPPAAPKALGGTKWSDQGAKERSASSSMQASTMKSAGDTPTVQTGTAAPKSTPAPTPPSRPADLGAPKADVPTPPSRPPMASDLPKIDTGPSANPQGPGTSGADGADGASIAGGKGGKGGKGGSSMNESVQVGDRTYRIV